MQVRAQSTILRGDYDPEKVTAMAKELAAAQGQPSRLAFVFVTDEYVPHLEEFCDTLRVDGRIVDVVGCTGGEVESAKSGREKVVRTGCSVLAFHAPETEFSISAVESPDTPMLADWMQSGGEPMSLVAVFDPNQFAMEEWMGKVNSLPGGVACCGGFASAANAENIAVFHNGRIVPGGVGVGIRGGGLGVRVLVSQGCRPIGEPLTVTRAESNVIYALGGQPAYQVLETAFETLSNDEKETARGNLFAGLATSEYVDEFDAGDFLVRHIVGADPNSGAVVIAGLPRVGQTLQYQFRDRASASQDLSNTLQNTSKSLVGSVLGSLLFRCVVRGEDFFGQPCHDLEMMQHVLGAHPSAALACNGEIGLLNSVNCITAYTASAAVFTTNEK